MTFYYVTFPKTKTNGYKTKMFCTGIRFENCMSGLSLTTRTPEKSGTQIESVFRKRKNRGGKSLDTVPLNPNKRGMPAATK